jgi:hypothetical protein
MQRADKYGFPRTSAKASRMVSGFQTGDIVKAIVTKGKKSAPTLDGLRFAHPAVSTSKRLKQPFRVSVTAIVNQYIGVMVMLIHWSQQRPKAQTSTTASVFRPIDQSRGSQTEAFR